MNQGQSDGSESMKPRRPNSLVIPCVAHCRPVYLRIRLPLSRMCRLQSHQFSWLTVHGHEERESISAVIFRGSICISSWHRRPVRRSSDHYELFGLLAVDKIPKPNDARYFWKVKIRFPSAESLIDQSLPTPWVPPPPFPFLPRMYSSKNEGDLTGVPRTGTEYQEEPGNQRQGVECVFPVPVWGVSQEEVQKKTQLGTTQQKPEGKDRVKRRSFRFWGALALDLLAMSEWSSLRQCGVVTSRLSSDLGVGPTQPTPLVVCLDVAKRTPKCLVIHQLSIQRINKCTYK
jgi:hypothetical protein